MTGTNHFKYRAYAYAYYSDIRVSAKEVDRKIQSKEIVIGKPEGYSDEQLHIDENGRYWIK